MTSHVMQEMQRFNNLLGEIDAAYHEASQKLGLTDSAMQVLYVLCNDGGESLLSRICGISGASKQTINSALRGLEKEDCIRLETVPGRRKKVGTAAPPPADGPAARPGRLRSRIGGHASPPVRP